MKKSVSFLKKLSVYLGKNTLIFLRNLGGRGVFFANVLYSGKGPFINYRVFINLFAQYFWYSLPLVGMTAICAGMVLALQSAQSMHGFDASGVQVELVVFAILRELGPILAGLMVAGRLGSSIASELSSMAVTDQINALVSVAVSPFYYLIRPKISAALCVLPLLTLFSDLMGIFGGYITCVLKQGMHGPQYLGYAWNIIQWSDVEVGLYKSFFFAFIIGFVACYEGLNAPPSALGVGISARKSVVISSLLILFINYWVTFFYYR
ncbi:MlaE family ABC transporter permease [Holospora curviuscula]|uniref:Putative phospholipid ABC transporter permease protein MlaE n=1 Tax=Holospora curviuscula TaxID=1082868 RepID=A0A2S5R8D9_9PROT|nr:ABC transporter permease [Holospora curviuscula]PPE03609.1 putative phospholipid ABC transporter permease protein MlaE [Holospora curviuscula]